MHPSSSCLLQARPLLPAIELFVKVSTVQCVFMEEFLLDLRLFDSIERGKKDKQNWFNSCVLLGYKGCKP